MGEQEILKNINLHIHCGTLAAVIGKNGAGKSTLIKAILGDIPHTGTIEFSLHEKGTVISNKKMDLKIGYVPQSLNIEEKDAHQRLRYDRLLPERLSGILEKKQGAVPENP